MSLFEGKKVVVTGGAGFVGSHLVELLCEIGAQVSIVDNLSHYSWYASDIPIWRRDAGSKDELVSPFENAFAVFNLAAHVAGVQYNQANQLEMFEQNLRLQLAPVLAAEQCGVPHFLQVSSVCVYAPEYNSPALEENGQRGEPVGANNGYSWAKRMGERAALYSAIPHVVIVRPSNIYGPRDHIFPLEQAHVIPALIEKTATESCLRVNGSGKEVREFIYVEDVARGMIAALSRGRHQTAYNLGTNGATGTSIADLVGRIQKALGTARPVEYTRDYDPGDPARWSDARSIFLDTGWAFTVGLDDGLTRTASWYKEKRA